MLNDGELRIAYCQLTYPGDYSKTKQRIVEARDWVDNIIIAIHDNTPRQAMNLVRLSDKTKVISFHFEDNIPQARNVYLRKALEIGIDWIIVSDPDEQFCEDFWKNIRSEIQRYDSRGVNILGVRCREAFEPLDWTDDLDLAKQYPNGFRDSNYHKDLVFRIYSDTMYKGVGPTGTVHETWFSPTHPWRPALLPDNMYYLHSKTALDIWRNGARNMYMGGGGDNVGELNPLWKPLRGIFKNDRWMNVVKAVEGSVLPDGLVKWVIKALTYSATDWGTECREFAKWVIYNNRVLLRNRNIRYGLHNPPKPSKETLVEQTVRRMYFQYLGRHPDRESLDTYVKAMVSGKLSEQQLVDSIKSSEEYLAKYGEILDVKIPVSVKPIMTPDIALRLLQHSTYYRTVIKPRLDLGEQIESVITNKEGFYRDLYSIIQGPDGRQDQGHAIVDLIKKYLDPKE